MIIRDALSHDFGDEHFDLVLMNPPFKDGKQNLYDKFLDKLLPISTELVTIHPFFVSSNQKSHYKRLHKFVDVGTDVVPTLKCGVSYYGEEQDTYIIQNYASKEIEISNEYKGLFPNQIFKIGREVYEDLFTKHKHGIGLNAIYRLNASDEVIKGIWRRNWDEYYYAEQTAQEACQFGAKRNPEKQNSSCHIFPMTEDIAKVWVKN